MLLVIRPRFDALHGFPALTLVVFCQIPPWKIPPGLHQVRTGPGARMRVCMAGNAIIKLGLFFLRKLFQTTDLDAGRSGLLGFCSISPIFRQKVTGTIYAQS